MSSPWKKEQLFKLLRLRPSVSCHVISRFQSDKNGTSFEVGLVIEFTLSYVGSGWEFEHSLPVIRESVEVGEGGIRIISFSEW